METKKNSISTGTNSSQENEISIGEDYRLYGDKKLGSGAFGEIYKGFSSNTNEEVAIKLESVKIKHTQLYYEYKLYSALQGGSKF